MKRIRTWIFNRQFHTLYYGLLMTGELYNAKVDLLTRLKENRGEYLRKYLSDHISLFTQVYTELKK
jgi:hypothetical protein